MTSIMSLAAEHEDALERSGGSDGDGDGDGDAFGAGSPGRHRSATVIGGDLGLGGALELLNEELQQEIAPRKLLRQFSLNILPCTSSGNGGGVDSGRSFRPNASLQGMIGRFERQQLRWRNRGSSDSLAEMDASMAEGDGAGLVPALSLSVVTPLAGDPAAEGAPAVQQAPVNTVRNDTFEAKFGDGFLGLEFVINDARRQVMVKSVQPGSWSKNILQIPPGYSVTRGLIVDAINGREVSTLMPEEVLDMLQYTQRPLSVRFRRCEESMVVCKLCECKVDAWSLDEHTNYCVMSRRIELEADQINNALSRLAMSIKANLESDTMRTYFHPEALHFYNALRVIAIQASSCDVSQVESFALCSRLIKILDRIRQQEPPESSNFAVERGIKYCHRIRNLVHAKMSKMRQTQKVLLQQAPNDGRAPFHRTKSLEEVENGTLRNVVPPPTSVRRPSAYRVSIRDFRIIKPISKGAFGKVYLARKKTTGDQYAIKVLAKEHVLRKKQIQHIETERDILVSVESPFVVKLFWTFQTKRNLFLVMEYLPGGDFMSLLECIVQLEEQVARVYIAEVALALNHLHMKGCVHRDLKPDNILISSSGHIKLTDFGLSEEGVSMSDSDSESPGDGLFRDEERDSEEDLSSVHRIHSPEQIDFDDDFTMDVLTTRPKKHKKKKRAYSHTYGRCGTPDYLSPEIILAKPHGPPVDYWALGVILYEMLVGFPPFNDETVEAIFNNILERQILWPDGEKCLSNEAIDLINQLLEPDPSKRLGWEGLRKHSFFEGIDWDTILESTPPFVPTLEGPNDTSYFNNRNLTDVFIDDDEFDFDAQSMDSNTMDHHSESGGGDDMTSSNGRGGEILSDEQLMNSLSAFTNSPTETGDGAGSRKFVIDSGSKTEQDPSLAFSEPSLTQHSGISCSQRQFMAENNLKFPSGMYTGARDDSEMTEAFKSFSFTNMNALAAASRNEAEMIADTRLSEVENSSSLSILI